MYVFTEYNAEDIFTLMSACRRVIKYFGRLQAPHDDLLPEGTYYGKLTSPRLQLFHTMGKVCVTCGLEGTFFRLETSSIHITPHLNFYGRLADGTAVIFTKDHIVPKSLGGPSAMENYQPMCGPCNWAKGNGGVTLPSDYTSTSQSTLV